MSKPSFYIANYIILLYTCKYRRANMKKVLTVTIEEELLNVLKKTAESENRNLSNLVETLLYKAINDTNL
jgi:hypothetical protein